MPSDKTVDYTSVVTYEGNLRTKAVHQKSQQVLITDAPVDNHGKGEAFSPTDLVATSLASCMLTIMGIAANTHKIPLGKITIYVKKIMAEHPRRIGEIVLKIVFENDFSPPHRKILEMAALQCPVMLSLHPEIKKRTHFIYPQDPFEKEP